LSLYVGVAVSAAPQDCFRVRLLFGFAAFFGVCFGVAVAFLFTRTTWFYVEVAAVWMWRYAETSKNSQETKKQSKRDLFF
jgi:hypothetical protein